jgi:hypothetical protein
MLPRKFYAAQSKYNMAGIGVKKKLIMASNFAGNFIGESNGYDVKSGTRDQKYAPAKPTTKRK